MVEPGELFPSPLGPCACRLRRTPKEAKMSKKTCFVVMGFGKKVDAATGRTLDLDSSYKNIIKRAVEAADLNASAPTR